MVIHRECAKPAAASLLLLTAFLWCDQRELRLLQRPSQNSLMEHLTSLTASGNTEQRQQKDLWVRWRLHILVRSCSQHLLTSPGFEACAQGWGNKPKFSLACLLTSALCQQNVLHHVATGCFLHLLHHFQGSYSDPLPHQWMKKSIFVVRVVVTSLETNSL